MMMSVLSILLVSSLVVSCDADTTVTTHTGTRVTTITTSALSKHESEHIVTGTTHTGTRATTITTSTLSKHESGHIVTGTTTHTSTRATTITTSTLSKHESGHIVTGTTHTGTRATTTTTSTLSKHESGHVMTGTTHTGTLATTSTTSTLSKHEGGHIITGTSTTIITESTTTLAASTDMQTTLAGSFVFAAPDVTLSSAQVSKSAIASLSNSLNVPKSQISVSVHEARRLKGWASSLRQLAGTWVVDFEVAVSNEEASQITANAAVISSDGTALIESLERNLVIEGANAQALEGALTMTSFSSSVVSHSFATTPDPSMIDAAPSLETGLALTLTVVIAFVL